MKYKNSFSINRSEISISSPTYFIADVASNHDGSLERAKELIWKAKEAGADAAKFQHFLADKIVSDHGFKNLGHKLSHQSGWKKSVFDIFRQYECNREWTEELVKTAREAEIDFMTTPYDYAAVDELDCHLPAYKIGSGDITWTQFIEFIAQKNKPVLIATGASDIVETDRAVQAVLKHNPNIALLQCNTNYTGSIENFKCVNLNVLKTFATMYPNMVLGLSDHTPFHAAVLGAVALGARVIEKHFTDDNSRIGPDHPFSMNPKSWKEMVERTRELEFALGDGIKRVESNERETVVVQRRCLRFKRDMKLGEKVAESDLEALRPAPFGSVPPYAIVEVVGRPLASAKTRGEAIFYSDVTTSMDHAQAEV